MLTEGYGLNVVNLSIDDVYLTRAERLGLGETVHPLCAIRGVPGTHDVSLTQRLFDDLLTAGPGDVVPIPRFDKAIDDRVPEERWERAVGPVDLVFFEGWCVGCTVLPEWTGPYNNREAREDAEGRWAKWSDSHLSTDYQRLFGRLDFMLMLRVPSMETVRRGRWLQEQKLWAHHEAVASDLKTLTGLMTKEEVMDYVALFERHTEHMLASLPDYCEVLVSRDDALRFALDRLGAPRMSRAV